MYHSSIPAVGPSVATGGVLVSTGEPLAVVLSAAAIVLGCSVGLVARSRWRAVQVETDGPRYRRHGDS